MIIANQRCAIAATKNLDLLETLDVLDVNP